MGSPAYQSFGRKRRSSRSAITPSIRIGPTFCELMKIAKSVAAAMKMAAGSVTAGGVRSGLDSGASSRIELMNHAESLQHQPLIDQLDHRRLGRDQSCHPPGGNHTRVLAEFLLDSRHHPFHLGREAEDDAGLHALGGGPPDDGG